MLLGIEPSASYMLAKHFTTELYPQLHVFTTVAFQVTLHNYGGGYTARHIITIKYSSWKFGYHIWLFPLSEKRKFKQNPFTFCLPFFFFLRWCQVGLKFLDFRYPTSATWVAETCACHHAVFVSLWGKIKAKMEMKTRPVLDMVVVPIMPTPGRLRQKN